jgi:hypothetical protein
MSEHKLALRQVVRIDQSPMNARQWCVQLSCGHDEYVTRKSKPQMKFMICQKCSGREDGF